MDADQLLLLFVVLLSLTVTLLLIYVVIPSLARNRLTLQMSVGRDEVDRLLNEPLSDAEEEALYQLDDVCRSHLRFGRVPASYIAVAFHTVRKAKRIGEEPAEERTVWRRLHGVDCAHRIEIDKLERRIMKESFRASVMGSPLWFVLWPIWILAEIALRHDDAPICESPGEVKAEKTLIEAIEIRSSQVNGARLATA